MPRATINGKDRDIESTTVAALIIELGLANRMVAVEKNTEIVKKDAYSNTPIADGDVIEVLHFVGGG